MHIENFDPYDFQKKEVNGVTIYYKNLPWAPCIHTHLTFSVGAFNDAVGKEGTAHFLEHVVHNGSPLVKDRKALFEFSRLYMLNSRNAFTSHNKTAYVGKCLPEHFHTVLTTMSDYVFKPFLKEEGVETERKIITQEAWGRYKNAKFLAYVERSAKNLFAGHVRSRISSPLGWPNTVAAITQQDLASFHKQHYVKENLSVFLVGAVEETHVLMAAELLKDVPNGVLSTLDAGTLQKPLAPRLDTTGEEIGDPHEQLEFSLERVTDTPIENISAVARLTSKLLYDALLERLRLENSLCYGVSGGIGVEKRFTEGYISVNTSEDKLELVEKETWNVVREIIDGKWEDRFAKLHKLALDETRSRERLSEEVLSGAEGDITQFGRIITVEETLDDVAKATYADVQNMLKVMFDPEYVFTEIIRPSKKTTA